MAKGIDILIDRLKTRLSDKLFTTNDCDWFGRVFRNVTEDGIIPEIYLSVNDYKEVLLNDKKDLTCFFDVLPNDAYDFQFSTDVQILFSVNLKKLYPTVTTERATEYIHEEVIKQIKKIGGWKVTGIVRGLPAFADYANVKPTDDLHPFYLFRINCEVKYNLNC